MKLNLPSPVLSVLAQRGGTLNPNLRGSPSLLQETCAAHGYALHQTVIDFEAAFGGLMMPDEGRKLKKGEPHWLFGAYACLSGSGHAAPRGGTKGRNLVPVVYAPNDVIYFLDAQGKAFVQDTIEDPSAVLYAADATALVCRILFDEAIFSRKETSSEFPGLQGESLSLRLALTLVTEASGADLRYYGDATGAILVVEDIKAKQTRCACATKIQFDLVKPPILAEAGKLSDDAVKNLAPFLGKASLRLNAAQLESVPDIFDHLPELRELDISGNSLSTLPVSLWRAKELATLDISFNPLTTLADGIANMKALRALSLRGCHLRTLPDALAGAKNLTKLMLTECEELDVDAALQVIAKLPKIKDLSLPLARSLTSLAPLAHLPIKELQLNGARVQHPDRLPAGLGQLKKLTDLRIVYADHIAQLPESQGDVLALRLLFGKRFTDADIKKSAHIQPEKLYLRAYADTL
jgi:Leucine rich repeat